MKRINILDQATSNKIAAGEVVERPSSVVKELLENSLDAGASSILIEIEEGGKLLIRIIDDGYGIHKDDLETAFKPHATSKIGSIEDLNSIKTMGFRGEALPSIAAVSKTRMVSKTEDSPYANEVYYEGGHLEYIKEAPLNKGTMVEVRDLFYNVPARLKFLKSTNSETSQITDIVNRLAIAHSNVSFKYINNGRKVLNTYGSANIKDVLREIYGKNILNNIISLEGDSDVITLYGFIGNREVARGSRNHQSIFVNKRYIKSKLITAAVENAFKSFITINSFPFFVVFIDAFPDFIDVNVHPTKSEIKFSNERLVYKTVFDVVHGALRELYKKDFSTEDLDIAPKYTNIEFDLKDQPSTGITNLNNGHNKMYEITLPLDLKSNKEKVNEAALNDYSSAKLNDNAIVINEAASGNKTPIVSQVEKSAYDSLPYNVQGNEKNNGSIENNDIAVNPDFQKHQEITENTMPVNNNAGEDFKDYKEPVQKLVSSLPPLKIIGQFNKTYILSEFNEELYLIDQHAAHEKILFEKYIDNMKNANVVTQILLCPIIIDLSPVDYEIYAENKDIFKRAGYELEPFGENSVIIKEVPLILGSPKLSELFLELINNLRSFKTGELTEVYYMKIATISCKAAIKANDELSFKEMEDLINKLNLLKDPYTCPHGRPTIIKLTLNEIEKRFKRIL